MNARTQNTLYTPLHLASQFNFPEIAKILLAYGAKINVLDSGGKKPSEIWV